MKELGYRLAGFVFAAATAGVFSLAVPCVSEASFARQTGTSYGGTLSTNGSLSTQQLTSDPASILKGSVSTEYQPELVSLTQLIPGPEFNVSALIGIRLDTDAPGTERFVTDAAYFSGLPYEFFETGYIQVSFERNEGSDQQSIIDPLPGYVFTDDDGETDGDDTHAFLFTGLSPNAVPTYHIYQEDGTNHDVLPDYLIDLDDNVYLSGIDDATVSGPVPEPSTCLLALGGFGLALLRRSRRVA